MANKKFEMYEIRHVITRILIGESDRETERAAPMGPRKAGQLRTIAIDLAAPMAALICTWMEWGIQATTIHEALVDRYGFKAATTP